MQQQIDFIIFAVSNSLIIFFCILIFRYNGRKTIFINLNKKQLIWLCIIETVLFTVMYFNYEFYKSPDVAESFAWHYSLIYARGVLPLVVFIGMNNPVIMCLVVGLIIDYVILLICTKIAESRYPNQINRQSDAGLNRP
jgi:hypothetical protein